MGKKKMGKQTRRLSSVVVPKLPLAPEELRSASVELAEHFAPEFLEVLAANFGLRLPAIPARVRRAMAPRFRRGLLGMRPHILGLELLDGRLAPGLARYAFLEGLTREQLKVGGVRLRDGDDACQVLLGRLEEQAAPHASWRRIVGYADAHASVVAFANVILPHIREDRVASLMKLWLESDDARKVIHFGQRLPALMRGWRRTKPTRIGHRLVAQLTHQYRDCAAVFEQCLRRFVALDRARRGHVVRWRALERMTLARLLELAVSGDPSEHLRALLSAISRDVRNVLAHGHPTVDARHGVIEFRGKGRVLVAWTPGQFFEETWRLTAHVLAMLKLDEQLQLAGYRSMVERLAANARDEQAGVVWWNARRSQVHQWVRQQSPQLGDLYIGAVRLLYGQADVPGRLRLVAHAVREIRNRLPDAVAPGERRGRLEYKERLQELRESFEATTYGRLGEDGAPDRTLPARSHELLQGLLQDDLAITESNVDRAHRLFTAATRSGDGYLLRPLARDWYELGEWFMRDVHVGDPQAEAQNEADYRAQFSRFETVLFTLSAEFFEPLAELDNVLANPHATVEQALDLVRHDEQVRYLFEHLERPDWVGPLAVRQFFANPPAPRVEEGGAYVTFPVWPALRYLVRVAARAPDAVLAAAERIPRTDNMSIRADLIELARQLPARQSAQLTRKLLEWLRGDEPLHGLLEHRVEPLVAHLADGGEARVAEDVLTAVARIRPGPTKFASPVARIPTWSYARLFRNSLPRLVQLDGERFFERFINLLRVAAKCGLDAADAQAGRDWSNYWREAIETSSGHVDDPRDVLVESVRDTALRLASSAEGARRVLERLEREGLAVFRRIALHVLLERRALLAEEAASRATDTALLGAESIRREHALLLAVVFPTLPVERRLVVLEWIERGPDLRLLDDQEDSVKTEHVERWQLDKLVPISDALEGTWRARYEALAAKYGPVEDPRGLRSRDVWSGPTSPFGSADLATLALDELVERLRTWVPPTGWMVPSPAGLGRQLSKVVAADPLRFADAKKVVVLEPTYVRAVLDGFQNAVVEGRAVPWGAALEILEWVVCQPIEPDGGDALHRDAGCRWARATGAHLLKDALVRRVVPPGSREQVWSALSKLLGDPDPSAEDEEERIRDDDDASSLSINCTRSVTLEAVIHYALWVKESLGPAAPRGLDGILEVRAVLEHHLDPCVEPSRAVRYVYGRAFGWLANLDREWLDAHLADIFGPLQGDDALGLTAWGACLAHWTLGTLDYERLAPWFADAVLRLGRGTKAERTSVDELLTHHLARLYWSGVISLDGANSPLRRFYDTAPAALRAHLLAFVGTVLHRTKEADISTAVGARLRALWEFRLGALVDAPPSERDAELAAFGFWFARGNLGIPWLLEKLEEGLRICGRVELASYVLERLGEYAQTHTLEALECLTLMVKGDAGGVHIASWKAPVTTVLECGLANPRTSTKARALVNELGRLGFIGYRALLASTPSSRRDESPT